MSSKDLVDAHEAYIYLLKKQNMGVRKKEEQISLEGLAMYNAITRSSLILLVMQNDMNVARISCSDVSARNDTYKNDLFRLDVIVTFLYVFTYT